MVRDDSNPTPVEPVDLESLPEGKFRTLVVDPTVCVYRVFWFGAKLDNDCDRHRYFLNYIVFVVDSVCRDACLSLQAPPSEEKYSNISQSDTTAS